MKIFEVISTLLIFGTFIINLLVLVVMIVSLK